MTRYTDIANAAERWRVHQEQARDALEKLLNEFVHYCEIPEDRIRFSPWDDQHRTLVGSEAESRPLKSAIHFDNATNEWGVGVSLLSAPPEQRPQTTTTFSVRIKAIGSDLRLKFGSMPAQPALVNESHWRAEFCSGAAESLRNSFIATGEEAPATGHGFHASIQT